MTAQLRIAGLVAGWTEPVLHGVDLDVPDGQLCAVLGPNGSGKSTLLKAIYRAIQPTGGRVLLGTDDIAEISRAAAARRIGVVAQQVAGGFDFTAAEMVLLGRTPHLGVFGSPRAADRQLAAVAMARTGCLEVADRPLSTLSGGEVQRVLIARAFAQEPDALLLDEPTNHLDPRHQLELLALLAQSPQTVIVALHSLDLAARYAEQVVIMNRGRIAAVGAPQEAITEEVLREVFGVAGEFVAEPGSGRPRLLLNPLPR